MRQPSTRKFNPLRTKSDLAGDAVSTPVRCTLLHLTAVHAVDTDQLPINTAAPFRRASCILGELQLYLEFQYPQPASTVSPEHILSAEAPFRPSRPALATVVQR